MFHLDDVAALIGADRLNELLRRSARLNVCSLDDCDKPARTVRGLCGMHYMRLKSHGDTSYDVSPAEARWAQVGECNVESCDRKVHKGGDRCRLHTPGAIPPCSIEGCDEPQWARGWCGAHYQRWMNNGDPNVVLSTGARRWAQRCTVEGCNGPDPDGNGLCRAHTPCKVEGCDRMSNAKGLCTVHYQRLKETGEVGPAHRLRNHKMK